MKRIILSGATSMIGLKIIEQCIENNIEVLALCRNNSEKAQLIPSNHNVEILYCDLSELNNINFDIAKSYDAFLHLGWTHTSNKVRYDCCNQALNINYTLEAVKLAKRADCKKFVGAGSQAEYGRVEGVINESRIPNPDSPYGVCKYSAGFLSRIMCEQIGLEHNWVRIFSTYGENDGSDTLISYLLKQLKNNEPCELTLCEQIWDYLYVGDCASALLAVAEFGKNKATYNIGSGKGRPLKEFVEIIKNLSNSKSKIIYGGKDYSVNQVMHLCADTQNLRNDTGWKNKVSFEEGIKKVLLWDKKRLN